MLPTEYLYYLIGLIYDRAQALRITVQKTTISMYLGETRSYFMEKAFSFFPLSAALFCKFTI